MKQTIYNSSLVACLFLLQIVTTIIFFSDLTYNPFVLAISMTVVIAGLFSALVQLKFFRTKYLHYLALFLFIAILLLIRAKLEQQA
jgi:hypothetical protein